MAYQWVHGVFQTGAVLPTNVLPVIKGSDTVNVDINAGDNAIIAVSKRDLNTSNWRNIITEGSTLIGMVDPDKAWNDPTAWLFAGWANKADGTVGESIQVQIVSLHEYMAARIVSPLANSTSIRPLDGVVFQADTHQGVLASIIGNCFAPIPGSPAQPPQVLGTIQGSVTGSAIKRGSRLSDAETYASIADGYRNTESPNGNEYRFVPRWANANKNRVVWDVLVGNDTDGKINWVGTNTSIVLSSDVFHSTVFTLTASSEAIANRVIGQSKMGSEETNTGSDYTAKTVANGRPLFDAFFNPGVELTDAQMQAQLTARVTDLKEAKGTASYEISGDPPSLWLGKLGSKVTFTGSGNVDSEGYDVQVRVTGLSFSASNNIVRVTVMLPQSRYPKLPAGKGQLGSDFGGGSVSGDSSSPVYSGGKPVTGGYKPINYVPPTATPNPDEITPPPPELQPFDQGKYSADKFHAAGISDDGNVYVWGTNAWGQLGIVGLVNAPYPTVIEELGIDNKAVICMHDESFGTVDVNAYTMVLKTNGDLYVFGGNTEANPLGVGYTNANVSVPVKIMEGVKQINTCSGTKYALKEDGTLWSWGRNQAHEAGQGLPIGTPIPIPTVIAGHTWLSFQTAQGLFSGGTAMRNSVLAIDTAGAVWEWGNTRVGDRITKVNQPAPATVPMILSNPGDVFKEIIRIGGYFSLALKEDGKVFGVGVANWAGTTTTTIYQKLTELTLINDVKSIQPYNIAIDNGGGGTGDWGTGVSAHFIKNDGTFWTMGSHYAGTIGQGASTGTAYIPTQMGTDSDWVDAKVIKLENSYVVAKQDGTLWGWGQNTSGKFGLGNTTNILVPTLLLEDVNQIEASFYHSTFAQVETDLYVTGSNVNYRLGIGSTVNKTSWTFQS